MVNKNQFDYKQLAKDVFRKDLKIFNINDEKGVINYVYKNLSFNFETNNEKIDVYNQESIVNFLIQHFMQQFGDNQKESSRPIFHITFHSKINYQSNRYSMD